MKNIICGIVVGIIGCIVIFYIVTLNYNVLFV